MTGDAATGRAVVIGGGLAGLAAAVRLAEGGTRVEVLETRSRLGGATYSFRRDGLVVDNGQHVFLRCYTAYRDFLERIGAARRVRIQRRFAVPVLTSTDRRTRLRRVGLPAPFHLVPTLAAYPLLGPPDRVRVLRAAAALRSLDPEEPALDVQSFGGWLADRGQSARAVQALWNLFTVAALNTDVDGASLALAAKVFRTGLLDHASAGDIGLPAAPLEEVHGAPAAARLGQLGATVRTGCRVTAIRRSAGGLEVSACGETFTSDVVVLAVPHSAAATLLPTGAVAGAGRLAELGAAPIVNVHVVYDRHVTDLPFAATVGSPAQWIFDRTEIAGADHGQYIAVSVSAADRYVDVPTAAIQERFVPELHRLLPGAREARIERFFVTRERRATFLQRPGSAALRPRPATGIPGLFLAGAWTGTGWPDTMEGAVRSGDEAARLAGLHLAGLHLAGLPARGRARPRSGSGAGA
ncbi:MAG: hydroxysqualene dehydroxylase HpnE [Carbonactinosporaceae bacterium]